MPDLCGLVLQILVWYLANLGFNVGMKRSHALVPDVLVLTTFQFGAGAIVYGAAWLAGYAKLPHAQWAVPLAGSAILLLGGTLLTNVSLTLLSVSFTHVIKTCEPFFTVVIVYFWDGKLPGATAALALAVTVIGVLVASADQRARAGKSNALVVGVGVAMLANLCLQLRTVLNKKLMRSSDAGELSKYGERATIGHAAGSGPTAHASDEQCLRPNTPNEAPAPEGVAGAGGTEGAAARAPEPLDLLLVTMIAGLPMQLALQGCADSYAALQPHPPTVSRYAHYGDAPVPWLFVPPVCFVAYQAASICVLSRVEPVTHAMLNSLKRMVVIGLGAAITHEPYSTYYIGGAAVAIVGVSAYSLAKSLRSSAAHARMRVVLVACALLLGAFASQPAAPAVTPTLREAVAVQAVAPQAREAAAAAAKLAKPREGPKSKRAHRPPLITRPNKPNKSEDVPTA